MVLKGSCREHHNLGATDFRYNPAALPPISRDHLLVLWQNGLHRPQVDDHAEDEVVIPLTQPAIHTGRAFAQPPGPAPLDVEEQAPEQTQLFTTSEAFKDQAVASATPLFNTQDTTMFSFSLLGTNRRDSSDSNQIGKGHITSVELLPPRSPPAPRVWDYFPPLRIFKRVSDWWKPTTPGTRSKTDERVNGGKRRRSGPIRSEIPQEILYVSRHRCFY